ncbi:hypothetical protein, partial [Paracoccus aminovorans]|uniref:hypothetical protein n=1 Tax=Paracoccus aminovorans TaxID=34004 RepID=UPI001B8D176E
MAFDKLRICKRARGQVSGNAPTGSMGGQGYFGRDGHCCTNPVMDSSDKTRTVAGLHEPTRIPDIQN